MRIDLNFSKYTHYEENIGFFRSLLDGLQEHPDVITAAVSGTFPLNEISPGSQQFMIEGPAEADMPDRFWADFVAVSPDYFRTVGVPAISGRAFRDDDLDESTLVVIVNESLARHHWGQRSPRRGPPPRCGRLSGPGSVHDCGPLRGRTRSGNLPCRRDHGRVCRLSRLLHTGPPCRDHRSHVRAPHGLVVSC